MNIERGGLKMQDILNLLIGIEIATVIFLFFQVFKDYRKRGVDVVNLNDLAKKVTLKEGKKKSISIAQIKEVMKLLFIELSKYSEDEQLKTIARYEKYGRNRKK